MKINLLFVLVLITLFCSCTKSSDNVNPNVFPKDKAPIFSVDKSTFKTSYAIGDTVKTTFTVTDNGYGQINQLYVSAYADYDRLSILGDVGEFYIDTVNINPPVSQYQYNMKWKIKANFDSYNRGGRNMLVSGDSVRFDITVIFAQKANAVSYWSASNDNKFNVTFKVK